MSRVLVTGAAGFIGRHLVARMAGAGHDVVATDLPGRGSPAASPASSLAPGAPPGFLPGDLTDGAFATRLVDRARPDVVVHLAADTATSTSHSSPTLPAHANVLGTATLLEALAGRPPAHLVLASSRAVYGEGPWADGTTVFHPPPRRQRDLARGDFEPRAPSGGRAQPVAATAGLTPPRPASAYAATKLAQEHLCEAWSAGHDVALSVLRLQNVYGPGQELNAGYSSVLALFAVTALGRGTIEVFEDGGIVRDFVYVTDVTAALADAVAHPPTELRVVDIASGYPRSLLEVATSLSERCGAPPPLTSRRFRPGDVRAAWADPAPAAADLAWAPAVPLGEGLERLTEWAAALRGATCQLAR